MYKKAGIIIAIALIVIAFLALGISNCANGGGIRIEQTSNSVESADSTVVQQSSKKQEDTIDKVSKAAERDVDEEQSVERAVSETEKETGVSEATEVSVVSEVSKAVQDSSKPVLNVESSLSEEDQSALDDLKKYRQEQSKQEQSASESSGKQEKVPTDSSETSDGAYKLKYKEITISDLPADNLDKDMLGVVKGKELLRDGNLIYTTILILGEDGDTYRYFVPMYSYESLTDGIKVDMTVRVYFEAGTSIKQVTSVKVIKE